MLSFIDITEQTIIRTAVPRRIPRFISKSSERTGVAQRRALRQGNAAFFPRESSRSSCQAQSRLFSSSATAHSQAPGHFRYRVAAAYCGKSHNFDNTKHYFSFDQETGTRKRTGNTIQKPDARSSTDRLPSGQDACFVSSIGSTEAVAFGVADGVGGWQSAGIDSAAFAHGICAYIEEAARHHRPSPAVVSPLELLRIGYRKVCSDKTVQGGGSTACVAVADGFGRMNVANLGDSGFMQLRHNKVHHYSDPQTHAFNTPYQLSQIPPKILAQMEVFGGGAPFSDMPSDASVTDLSLEHGDVLVFATDGVWDNLSSQDLLTIISDRMGDSHGWVDGGDDGTQVSDLLPELTQGALSGGGDKALHELLAVEVVQSAKEAGRNQKRDGPFAKAFQRVYPEEGFTGGKEDDIAVVVAIPIDPTFTPTHGAARQKGGLGSSMVGFFFSFDNLALALAFMEWVGPTSIEDLYDTGGLDLEP